MSNRELTSKMAFILFFLMVCSIFSSTLGRSRLSTSEIDPELFCDRDYSCVDCTTVRICAPTSDGQNLYEIKRVTCSSQYPYCDYSTGSCSTTPDSSCDPRNTTVSSNFTCMRDGYFPDPKICSLYYYCENEVAYQYSCTNPNAPFYHPGLQYCVDEDYYCVSDSSGYLCNDYCSEYLGRKIPIQYTNNYFVYCGDNCEIITVDKCIGDYYFSEPDQACKFKCPHAGLFLKDDNCANYIKCSPVLRQGFILTNMTCPSGQAFSESEYSCVDRSLVPNCNLPYSDLYSK